MKINNIFFLAIICLLKVSAQEIKTVIINDTLTVKAKLLYTDDFSGNLSNWIAQFEEPGSSVYIKNEKLEVDTKRGSTVWFDKKLNGPLIIEYDAVVIDANGANDRVSDLNCFWMASDPQNPENFHANIYKQKGSLGDYNYLKLYYVGFGGRNNSTTRLRRYPGDGSRPLLPEHDLNSKEYLLTGNTVNHIKIINYKGIVQFYRNNQLVFNFYDEAPFVSGYYGLRTTMNRVSLDNFKVYSIF
ncbi:DUF6250 domain-containing protein [Mariniflexile sp.]|uniref:DUF6250 domain-containing protein n=1 Tax=Mariniflexile sp. TaxID=1979402 RepID=UPI00356296EA